MFRLPSLDPEGYQDNGANESGSDWNDNEGDDTNGFGADARGLFSSPEAATPGGSSSNGTAGRSTCSLRDCSNPRFQAGYCKMHYAEKETQNKTRVRGNSSPGGGGITGKWWEKVRKVETVWQQLTTKDGLDYYFNTETQETSWDKPEELMTAEELNNKGRWFWVPDKMLCFVPGVVKEGVTASGRGDVVAVLEDGSERTIKEKLLQPLKRSSLQRVVQDLVLLDEMSPALILHNLRKRFEQNKIYTNVGTILISINPYQMLPYYTDQVVFQYKNRKLGQEMAPHVYNIAHDAHVGLVDFQQNQSIIISGESGAGKTECMKQCLQYLASLAGSVNHVETKVLQANPILEAFGNAKTIRNDNSSRFGKYVEIFFTERGRICGSTTTNYLLEKIRVVNPAPTERNFHIFYQLTKAASKAQRDALGLAKPQDYDYLMSCIDVDTIDDVKDFADLQKAFNDLGFSAGAVDAFFQIVASVLALGNVSFKDKGSGSAVTNQSWVDAASKLLGVESELLKTSLLIRELRIRGQDATLVPLSHKQAGDTRDALAKFIYGKMFDYLVVSINKAIPGRESSAGGRVSGGSTIGILDIFGFEIFEDNSFEQLCINFTNEMLQQHFNNQTFKLEEAVYRAEQIKFKHIEFIDNQPMLDLITKKPTGLLCLLDEELVMPKGSDKTFLEKAHEQHKNNKVYSKVMKNPKHFIIRHYAGEVTYDTVGFLEKNRDTLTQDLLDMLFTSTSPLVNELFNPQQALSVREQKSSLSKQFQKQLQSLMITLNNTEPHYIRCVKPNNSKAPMKFIPRNCMEQLTYSGVFEAVSIRKQGFPFRLSHAEFAERYKYCIGMKDNEGSHDLALCEKIITGMKINRENIQTGKTMMLYRAEEHKSLELTRSIKVKKVTIAKDLKRLIAVSADSMDAHEKEYYFMDLASAVREADIFKINTPEATTARSMLEAFVESRMDPETKRLLEQASRSKDREQLEHALQICDEKGYQTKLTRKCRDLLDKVVDAEEALAYAISECKEVYLEKALQMCDDFQYTSKQYNEAKQLLTVIRKAKAMITSCLKSLNHLHLQKTIEYCKKFNYSSAELDTVKDKYQQVMHCRSVLHDGMDSVSDTRLKEGLALAQELSYTCALTRESQRLCKRIGRINTEAKEAKNTLDEPMVRAVVSAASEIGLKNDRINYLRKLVKGPYQKFLAAQYERALKVNDHRRAIHLMVKKKDHLMSTEGAKFAVHLFPKLKEPRAWAHEKWFGNKEELARNMLAFQEASIHTPLTHTMPSNLAKGDEWGKIQNCFETVQKFMGQRNTSKMKQRIMELLTDGYKYPSVRTEVYLGFIKQMTNNPVAQATVKAWELFALCLTVFPPTPDFENHLEHWIRQHPEEDGRYNLRFLLRKAAYDHQEAFRGKTQLSNTSSGGKKKSKAQASSVYMLPRPVTRAEVEGGKVLDLLTARTSGDEWVFMTDAEQKKARKKKNCSYYDLLSKFYDKKGKPKKATDGDSDDNGVGREKDAAFSSDGEDAGDNDRDDDDDSASDDETSKVEVSNVKKAKKDKKKKGKKKKKAKDGKKKKSKGK